MDSEDEPHESDHAELEARDRAQPTLLGPQANLRADGDAVPDREERRRLLAKVERERERQREEAEDEGAEP